MHIWGDDWPHWQQLHESHDNIVRRFEKETRLYLSSKEKWGTLRWEWVTDKYSGKICMDKKNYIVLYDIIQQEAKEHPEIREELLADDLFFKNIIEEDCRKNGSRKIAVYKEGED